MNLYIDSQLDWPEKGLHVTQGTGFPEAQETTLTITAKSPAQLAINLRTPYWVQGGSVKINGSTLPVFSSPSSYLTLNRVWKTGDKIELSLPMGVHIDNMPDDAAVQAAIYGPLVLAARFEAVTRDMTYSGYGPKRGEQTRVPDIVADSNHPAAWIESDPKPPLLFHAAGQPQPITLVPLNQVMHERYAVYWKVKNKTL